MSTAMTFRGPGTAGDVMTRCPLSVPADADLPTLASALSGRVGAVPVVGRSGRPLGVLSQHDLLGAEPGRCAAELMAPVHSVAAGTPLRSVAPLLAGGAPLVCVLDDGDLVGVLTARDVLDAVLPADVDIDELIRLRVLAGPLLGHPGVHVAVQDAVVLLAGRVDWRSTRARIEREVRAVPGVRDVRDWVNATWNDEQIGTSGPFSAVQALCRRLGRGVHRVFSGAFRETARRA